MLLVNHFHFSVEKGELGEKIQLIMLLHDLQTNDDYDQI